MAPESPTTSTGLDRYSESVPSPNWPKGLLPQHLALPPGSSAHVHAGPVAIAVTPESPTTSTGVVRLAVAPSPN
nr:hypothetical protein [Rhodococcus qingshengii]